MNARQDEPGPGASGYEDDAGKITALSALAENFGKEFSEALLDLWLNLLAAYTPGQVFGAVRIVIERYEYKTLPPFAVLKKALDELAGVGEKALELEAAAEWAALGEAIGRRGACDKPQLHPATEHAVRLLGGWAAACRWETRDLEFRRRDFIRLWIERRCREDELARLESCSLETALAAGRGLP